MTFRYAIAVFLLFLCCGFAHGAPGSVILLAGEALDEKGSQRPLGATHRRLLAYLERMLDVRFDVRMYPWGRLDLYARNGEGLVLGLSKNTERAGYLHFSDAAYANNLWLVTRSDTPFPFNSMQDLAGKKIGAVRGYSYGEEFDRGRNRVFQVEEDISSRSSRLKKLLSRRMDALLVYQLATDSAEEVESGINSFMASEVKDMLVPRSLSFRVLPRPMQTENVYFSIAAEKDRGIIASINDALAKGRKSGELARILKAPKPD
ncbi:substrate-binding periplasmic protein [Undibacterium sp. TJN25]|uniref:substrate-binding periplasmic protein n=1 Tax=Undibacterium sp. TJN25 TaxID=3413056 RepID=UPI003BF1927E